MVHRVLLNDPLLTKLDLTHPYPGDDDPLIHAKLATALARNTHLEVLVLAQSRFVEIEALAASLQVNKTLQVLDIDRKPLSQLDLILIANAVAIGGSITELRCNTTRDLGQGHRSAPVWQAMVNLPKTNTRLRKLVFDMSKAQNQYRDDVQQQLARNNAAWWSRKHDAGISKSSSLAQETKQVVQDTDMSTRINLDISEKFIVPVQPEQSFSREQMRAAAGSLVEIIPGRCWVAPCVMTPIECEEWIRRGVEFGLEQNFGVTRELRTNSRTKDFVNTSMARLLRDRLPNDLIAVVAASAPGTEVRSVFEELRITQYASGQFFRAHFDDSVFRPTPTEHGERGEVSSHTVIAVLSEEFEGGATRFWPTGRYEHAVDVTAPLGSLLVFEQQTLLHEGMPIVSGVKHIAQTGLMRAPDDNDAPKPVLFEWGPGFSPF